MKFNLKELFLTLALSLIAVVSFSQGTLTGTVSDVENNEALIGATIVASELSLGTVTDFSGNFSLDLPAGKHVIRMSFVGYQDVEQEVSISNGETTELEEVQLKASSIGLSEVQVIASYAKKRETPVAISSIDADEIETKLGGQDLPSAIAITPSVYSTHNGGGYGDARVNIRGFNQRNVAVMINGIPVNDMESGWVYWSNWAGLGDATKTIQVQRGLGASNAAINSIGGTMNIITKTTDIEKGGSFKRSLTSYGLNKSLLSLGTGQLESGTAVQFVGSRTEGNSIVDGTFVDAWSYYLSISQILNDKHRLAFSIVGAPQEHGQRRDVLNQNDLDTYGANYNSQWGYNNGELVNERVNYYHKPQAALNWYWDVNDKTFVATSAYFSIGTGGGSGPLSTRTYDPISDTNNRNYNLTDNNGQIDYTAMVDENANNVDESYYTPTVVGGFSKRILRNSVNNHMWYGVVSTMKHQLSNNLKLTLGIDARGYKGEHYREVRDLLGGDYYLEEYRYAVDGVSGREQEMHVGDKIAYDNDGNVKYAGSFGQIEYTNGQLSVFGAATVSNTWYQRVDRYNYVNEADQVSDLVSQFGYNGKLGANYNIDKHHNVFVNSGYYSKAPDFRFLWPNYTNVLSTDNLQNETVVGFEAGYGFRSKLFSADINVYHTVWQDKSLLSRPYFNTDGAEVQAFITGLDATHKGIEFEGTFRPHRTLNVGLVASLGDWRWTNDVSSTITYEQTQDQVTTNLYLEGLRVGNSPQTQLGLKLDYRPIQKFNISADIIYYDKLFAEFSPEDRDDDTDVAQPWELDAYTMVNLYTGYTFDISGLDTWIGMNVYNLLDVDTWIDGFDGSDHDAASFKGYRTYARNFNFAIKVTF